MKTLVSLALAIAAVTSFGQLFSNGPMATGTVALDGTNAPAGTQWSQLQASPTGTPGANSVLGYSVNYLATGSTAPYRQGDDFFVKDDLWNIDTITVYGFRSGGSTTESFASGVVRIWSARPGTAGATVLAGDLTTNRLTSTAFSGLYRIGRAAGLATTTRPILAATLSLPTTLTRGTYWIEYGLNTTTGNVMSPLVTIPGRVDTPGANAFFYTSQTYFDMVDTNNNLPLAVPFEIRGTAVPEPASMAVLGLGTLALLRRRRRA